jgi:hypothetical protein
VQASYVQLESPVDGPILFERISTNEPPLQTSRRREVTIVALSATAIIALVVGSYLLDWSWTGFVDDRSDQRSELSAKTLWDWLDLLGVPAILAVGAWYLNRAETSRRSAEQSKSALVEQASAARRDYRDVVNSYVAVMTELLLEHGLRLSSRDQEVQTIARTRTLLALASVDGAHKGEVIEFLYRAGLILAPTPIVDLDGADLTFAELVGVDLSHADLSGSDLSGARLDASALSGAVLRRAILGAQFQAPRSALGTSLVRADLAGADLTGAQIGNYLLVDVDTEEHIEGFGTDFSQANLAGANLSGANLLSYQLTVTGTSVLKGGGEFRGPLYLGCNLANAVVTVDVDQLSLTKAFSGAMLP